MKNKFEWKTSPYPTTQQNDFREHKITKPVFSKGDRGGYEFTKNYRIKPLVPLDLQTMRPWIKKLPSNLYCPPTPVVKTNPRQRCKMEEIIPEKIDITKTRPCIYMVPAVNIDNVSCEKRKTICRNMYVTSMSIDYPSKLPITKKIIPETTLEESLDPVGLKYQTYNSPLTPKLLKTTRKYEWDYRRIFVDPTRAFWSTYEHKYHPEKPIDLPKETYDEIKQLVENDDLRMPFDRHMQGYTGYKPRIDIGSMSKSNRNKDPSLQICKK